MIAKRMAQLFGGPMCGLLVQIDRDSVAVQVSVYVGPNAMYLATGYETSNGSIVFAHQEHWPHLVDLIARHPAPFREREDDDDEGGDGEAVTPPTPEPIEVG